MSRNLQNIVRMILCGALILTLTACGGAQSQAPAQTSAAAAPPTAAATTAAPAQSAPAEPAQPASRASTSPNGKYGDRYFPEFLDQINLPVTETPIKLTYWLEMDAKMSATIKDYGEMIFYQKLAELTNVQIEFLHPPTGQARDQLNLLVGSGNLPDIIEYGWPSFNGGPSKCIPDGIYIELTDLVASDMPNFAYIMEQFPDMKREAVNDEGKYYFIPNMYVDPGMRVMDGLQMRKDWLDKLNLDPPETIDEWYNVMKTVVESDPNGNGQKDEIGIVFEKLNVQRMVGAWGIHQAFYHIDNKIHFGAIEPEYLAYLTEMNKWYEEGLLDRDFATLDNKMHNNKVTGDQALAWFAGVMGGMGTFLQTVPATIPEFDVVGAARPRIEKNGTSYDFITTVNGIGGNGSVISGKNQYPAESARWMDYIFTSEGHFLYNMGEEGFTYNWEGDYPKFTDEIMKNGNGWSIDQAIGHYARGNSGTGPHVCEPRAYEQRAARPQQVAAKALWGQASNARCLPSITPTAEESQRYARIMNDVNTYRDEMMLKFIMGQEPLSNYDAYVKNIEGMGIQEAIDIQQVAYDRFLAR